MVLALVCMLVGVLVSMCCLVIGFNRGVDSTFKAFNAGVDATTLTGQHFVDTYVKKLTPDDVAKLNKQDAQYIPEENLRALDIDEDKYRRVMGWNKEGPDISDGSHDDANY